MSYSIFHEKSVSISDDKILIERVLKGNHNLAAQFLKQKCILTFSYIKNNRLKRLDLDVNDLIDDFFLYLQEDDWEKLRSFRFESKLQTWVNLVASRYLLKKYSKMLKEISLPKAPIDGIQSFVDEDHNSKLVRADLLEAISLLEEKRERMVLLLTLEGYEVKKIAQRVNVSKNEIKLGIIKHRRDCRYPE